MNKKYAVLIFTLLFFLLLIFSPVFYFRGKKSNQYKMAESYLQKGDFDSAWKLFSALGDFKDSKQKLEVLEKKDFLLPLKNASKGDFVRLGRFEQDGFEASGLEAIEWLVLDKIDSQLLLLSSELLTSLPYNSEAFKEVTWEESGLRSFLNKDFYEEAFNPQEKEIIISVLNENADQSEVGTPGGNDTLDKVFLLSETEYNIYINDDLSIEDIGKARASNYAALLGVKVEENSFSPWWLRSPGVYPYSAQFVTADGLLYLSGAYVDIEKGYGVRPALWVKLGSAEEDDDADFE